MSTVPCAYRTSESDDLIYLSDPVARTLSKSVCIDAPTAAMMKSKHKVQEPPHAGIQSLWISRFYGDAVPLFRTFGTRLVCIGVGIVFAYHSHILPYFFIVFMLR